MIVKFGLNDFILLNWLTQPAIYIFNELNLSTVSYGSGLHVSEGFFSADTQVQNSGQESRRKIPNRNMQKGKTYETLNNGEIFHGH